MRDLIRFGLGSTRRVVVLGPVAFKFSRGKTGRKCNREEARLWKENRTHPSRGSHLCPVLWSSRRGWLLVMSAAGPLPTAVTTAELYADDWWDYMPGGDDWPCEPKLADWGMFKGRIVAVDYAANALIR